MRRATKTFEALRAIAIEDTRLYARIWTRKEWAERFLASGNKEISGLLFAMLDGKDASAVAWKLTKPMITGSQPVVHGRDLL